jgi:hypothetical protein
LASVVKYVEQFTEKKIKIIYSSRKRRSYQYSGSSPTEYIVQRYSKGDGFPFCLLLRKDKYIS